VAATVLRESAGVDRVLLVVVGAPAVVILLLGLALRWSAALTTGLVVLGAQQAVRLGLGTDSFDEWAPLTAAALLLCAELAWWSIEPRVPAWAQPELALRRITVIGALCAGGSAIGAVMLVAAGASLNGGVALELAGIVAATAAVAVVAYAARSTPR
jgi:hypothetical protein